MKSLPSFKYVLNPRAQVNRPELYKDTTAIKTDHMKDLPYEYIFQPMEDGRIFVTPASSRDGHKTHLLPVKGTHGSQTMIDKRTGLPIPVLNNQSRNERMGRRLKESDIDRSILFHDDIGKTIVLNSPEEAENFISNITNQHQYVEFMPEAEPNVLRHQKAAERVLAYKRKKWLDADHPSLIMEGDIPSPGRYDQPYSDEDINRIIESPTDPDTVPNALKNVFRLPKVKQVTDTYSDMPYEQPSVIRDLRAGFRSQSAIPVSSYTTSNKTMTEGFDFNAWLNQRNASSRAPDTSPDTLVF